MSHDYSPSSIEKRSSQVSPTQAFLNPESISPTRQIHHASSTFNSNPSLNLPISARPYPYASSIYNSNPTDTIRSFGGRSTQPQNVNNSNTLPHDIETAFRQNQFVQNITVNHDSIPYMDKEIVVIQTATEETMSQARLVTTQHQEYTYTLQDSQAKKPINIGSDRWSNSHLGLTTNFYPRQNTEDSEEPDFPVQPPQQNITSNSRPTYKAPVMSSAYPAEAAVDAHYPPNTFVPKTQNTAIADPKHAKLYYIPSEKEKLKKKFHLIGDISGFGLALFIELLINSLFFLTLHKDWYGYWLLFPMNILLVASLITTFIAFRRHKSKWHIFYIIVHAIEALILILLFCLYVTAHYSNFFETWPLNSVSLSPHPPKAPQSIHFMAGLPNGISAWILAIVMILCAILEIVMCWRLAVKVYHAYMQTKKISSPQQVHYDSSELTQYSPTLSGNKVQIQSTKI